MSKILSLICILCFSTVVGAQSFQGGVSGGINTSRIDNDGHERYGKLGLSFGAFVAREIMPQQLYWQMEINYSSRGKYDRAIVSPYYIDVIDLDYIELPLSLHYNISKEFQGEIGLAPDILIASKRYDQNGSLPLVDEPNLFGLTAFAGLHYFFRENMAAGLRFNYSAIPFHKFNAHAIRYWHSGYFHDVLRIDLKYYISPR